MRKFWICGINSLCCADRRKAHEAAVYGPPAVHLALSIVAEGAECDHHRSTGDRGALASTWLCRILAMEVSRASWPPCVPVKIRQLIREISGANPLWGAPRIEGELLKLGIDVARSTVAKYMEKGRHPPSQSWKTFLQNHADGIASVDFFVVPTIGFKLLFGFAVLRHGRRQIAHVAVTAHPTAKWIARQISEAFPWDTTPRYLVRDRDGVYGEAFRKRLGSMGIRDSPTAPRSPWQNAYVERLIGSIRRECLDHIVVFNEKHLRRLLRTYTDYCNAFRTHLSLGHDAPHSRPARRTGMITRVPQIGGLHQSFVRI